MRSRFCLLPLIILLVVGSSAFERSLAQSGNITVTVTGSGGSVDEARSDAIRQAMQFALKQLVVADRVISGDTIMRDRVLSTMNGYVERFREKNVVRTGTGVSLEAEITVSSARIENFLGIFAGGGGAISGPLLSNEQTRLLAQAQAEKAQAKARGEIFDRLFEEFPWGALDLKLIKVNISQANPNILILDMEQSYKPTFSRALEGTLRALADHECQLVRRSAPWGINSKNPGDRWKLDEVALMMVDERDCLGAKQQGVAYIGVANPHDTVCLGFSDVIKCFALAKGEYCRSCSFVGKRPAVFGRFIEPNGQSALVNDSCLVSAPSYSQSDEQSLRLNRSGSGRYLIAGIGIVPRRFQIQIDASKVNLAQAAHFVAISGLIPEKFTYSTKDLRQLTRLSNSSDPSSEPQDGCQLVDDAVRHHLTSP